MSPLLGGGGILILGGLPRGLTQSNEVHYLRWFAPVTMPTGYGANDDRPFRRGWVYTRPPRGRHAALRIKPRQLRRLFATKFCQGAAILKGKFESRSNNYAKSNVNR